MRALFRSRFVQLLAIGGLFALSAMLATPARANSVVSTVPAVGAVLSQAPNAVSVTAATSLLPDGNSLSVTDPNGVQVDDGSLTISDTTAVVGLKPLSVTGIYTVSYTLLSATDAPLTDSYTFLFNAPAVITTPTASPTPVVMHPIIPSNSSSSSAAKITVLVFLGLATVVALFLVWYARMIWRQSRKARKRRSHERGQK